MPHMNRILEQSLGTEISLVMSACCESSLHGKEKSVQIATEQAGSMRDIVNYASDHSISAGWRCFFGQTSFQMTS